MAEGVSEVVAFEAKAEGEGLSLMSVPGKIRCSSLAVEGGRVLVVTEERDVCCLSKDP